MVPLTTGRWKRWEKCPQDQPNRDHQRCSDCKPNLSWDWDANANVVYRWNDRPPASCTSSASLFDEQFCSPKNKWNRNPPSFDYCQINLANGRSSPGRDAGRGYRCSEHSGTGKGLVWIRSPAGDLSEQVTYFRNRNAGPQLGKRTVWSVSQSPLRPNQFTFASDACLVLTHIRVEIEGEPICIGV